MKGLRILLLVIAVVCIGVAVSYPIRYQRELQSNNEELADLIESDDIGRYMEKLAVENNGYAYPDERRYYDTSRD